NFSSLAYWRQVTLIYSKIKILLLQIEGTGFKHNYPCSNKSYGSSNISLMRTKNCTASFPSTIRWSYETATYIIGLTSIVSSGMIIARFSMLCISKIPTCDAFTVDIDSIDPKIQ